MLKSLCYYKAKNYFQNKYDFKSKGFNEIIKSTIFCIYCSKTQIQY